MSKRKIPSSNPTKTHFLAFSVSAPDLNLDILLHPNTTPCLAAAAKKLRSSSESPAQSTMMDARVPNRDFPDDDGNDSDSSSDIINTEIEPFPRSLNSIPAACSAFSFDILRKEGNIPTTHQLFPDRAGPELNPPATAPGQLAKHRIRRGRWSRSRLAWRQGNLTAKSTTERLGASGVEIGRLLA
ncbi:unnamed protein product [Linum trigynum]|uniref:Uncharacterized protein n=1 Tax=Linum trigynum TaxID=586398 RepID=A0AAV2D7D0_9ROSI